MNNVFNGMFGKIAPGMCRLSMSGGIAVKTTNGYKSYNLKTGRLTNCNNFVFNNFGEDCFFVIPTNKVEPGDIIIANNKPKCVIAAEKNKLTVINYEDSTIDTMLPERHVFMGNTYFYGKIVSIFGNNFNKGKNKMNKMMTYMVMSEMFKSGDKTTIAGDNPINSMSSMLPMIMLMGGGNGGNFFEDMFDFSCDDPTVDEDEDDSALKDEEEDEE